MNKDEIEQLNERFSNSSPQEVLSYFMQLFENRIALASSLSIEDQVILHMMTQISKNVRVFTLDTGRLFPETYALIDETNRSLGIKIEVYFPDYQQVEKMVKEHGINLFYHSIENRKLCCQIRKIEPLKRALKGLEAWVCGLRKDQSVTRFYTQMVEWDDANQLLKINPLVNWSEKQVRDYVNQYNIPYNPLHDKGFPSIGCQPCTRAIKEGEDVRAGRWWWETPEHKECGLHLKDK
ncbi:MAG: phosphoadenylyl-sulfate reductase [Bacteroidales bacterium]|nr:phosphoadenylyl-sulfate reductase [Bacteroidales bacterium]